MARFGQQGQTDMPRVDFTKLSPLALEYAKAICRRDGTLRASRPPLSDKFHRRAAYVWRMVMFQVSPRRQHQCLPICAPLYLDPADDDSVEHLLDAIVDEIVDAVPVHQWHGILRWGEAFGLVGTPRYAPDGAIVYRRA
jgi:hypothetical protein